MEPRNRQDMDNPCHLITHFQLRIQICFISQHDCFKRSSFHSTGFLQNTCKFLLHIDQELPIYRMILRLLLYPSFLHYIVDPLAAIVCFAVKFSRIRGTLQDVYKRQALDVSEKIPVYSVVNSLLDALDADKVQITVGGKDKLDTCLLYTSVE